MDQGSDMGGDTPCLPRACHTAGGRAPQSVGPGVRLDIHSAFKWYLLLVYGNSHLGSNKRVEVTADTYRRLLNVWGWR